MSDLQMLFTIILQTPGLPLRIGSMIGTAMLFGFILYDRTPNMFFRVTITFAAFFIFVEWIRMSIIEQVAPPTHPTNIAIELSVIIGLLFMSGFLIGMAFAHRYRKKIILTEEAAHEVLTKISNGDYTKSRINQKTKPINK